jgi:hypothetical protein
MLMHDVGWLKVGNLGESGGVRETGWRQLGGDGMIRARARFKGRLSTHGSAVDSFRPAHHRHNMSGPTNEKWSVRYVRVQGCEDRRAQCPECHQRIKMKMK